MINENGLHTVLCPSMILKIELWLRVNQTILTEQLCVRIAYEEGFE